MAETQENNAAQEAAQEQTTATRKRTTVIGSPFAGLAAGKKYSYTRKTWPEPQKQADGKPGKHDQTEHPAEVKEFPTTNARGEIINELRVQFGGKGRFFPLKELPVDGLFKMVALIVLMMLFAAGTATPLQAQTVQTNVVSSRQQAMLTPPQGMIYAGTVVSGTNVTNDAQFLVTGGGTVTIQETVYGTASTSTGQIICTYQTSNDGSNWVTLGTSSVSGLGTLNASAISNYYVGSVRYGQLYTTTAPGTNPTTNTVQVTTFSKNN